MSDYSPKEQSKSTPNHSMKQEAREKAEGIRHFVRRIFNLQSNVDKQQTKNEIKESIGLSGIQVYILAASIFIASIGLNANSTAVVIGAMLISPLMGPIVGFGYSIAVNDYISLRRSLMNFTVMVIVALLTSFIFFTLIPGGEILTTELRGRLEPTFLDVMIAIAGGFAGIVGASSKNKNINVVAGVAIATALMPPLCTVGYGLSMGSDSLGYKDYTGFTGALNAFYLFFINSTFIAISTFVFIKFLRFPLAKYQDAKERRKTVLFITIAAILVIIPSAYIFSGIFQDTQRKIGVSNFLQKEVALNYSNDIIDLDRLPNIHERDGKYYVYITAIQNIPPKTIENWNRELELNYNVKNTTLLVRQSGGMSVEEIEQLNEKNVQSLFTSTQDQIYKKDSIIQALESQISRLQSDSIPFSTISKELKIQYPELDYFGYGNYNYTNFNQREVIPTFALKWKIDSTSSSNSITRQENEERIMKFLKARLQLDTIQFLR